MKKILYFFGLMWVVGCAQEKMESKSITDVSSEELADVLLVDVRTPDEFNAGHMENAVNWNLYDTNFTGNFQEVDKDKTIYVYCKVGGRSAQAQKKLQAMG
ncbi:MAG: rhodanese-like domain-containing protein, partial [Flavobacteriaceae bacterium]